MTQAMITTIVPWITCARPGHSTFFSSAQDSLTKRPRSRGSRRPVCADGGCAAGPDLCLALARAAGCRLLLGAVPLRGLALRAALAAGVARHQRVSRCGVC